MTDIPSIPIALALGSNLGDRLGHLREAVKVLASCVEITATSPVYETAPAYILDQPVFLNAVVLGTTKLDPLPLLWALKNIEREIGRMPTFRFGPRVIDIDILFHGNTDIETTELTIPHPRMQERDFVLKPFSDIAPDWKHPKIGKTVSQMLTLLPTGTMTYFGQLSP